MNTKTKVNSYAPNMADAMNELYRRTQRRFGRQLKTLRELFPDVVAVSGNMSLSPSDLTRDSRSVVPGSVFFAQKGHKMDGHDYIQEALSRGALAIVSERPLPHDLPAVGVQVPSIAHAMSDAARRFWGMPERKLTLIGITGTKGKTTTNYLVKYLLQNVEGDCGMLSTIENDLGGKVIPATRTTVDALDWSGYMAQMVENGCRNATMEVSSHSLEQGRVLGLGYEVAIFTNLGHDHLDYHGTIENYYVAKRKLFDGSVLPRPKTAVINLDDAYGQRLQGEIHEKVETITYGHLPGCDLRIEEEKTTQQGSTFVLKLGHRRYNVELPLLGAHNIMNAAAALAGAYALGLNLKECMGALKNFAGVPGRLERIEMGQPFNVVVDFAHTTESLKQTLQTLRQVTTGKIITVFGCGGNRDTTKRPKMTQVAMQLSDATIATADNPRGERIEEIFGMMKAGVVAGKKIEFIADRHEAIERALAMAQPGDCVLMAGKGHETTQIFADAIIPFDDRVVAREALRQMGYEKIKK